MPLTNSPDSLNAPFDGTKQRREINKESGEEKLGAWSIICRLLPGPKKGQTLKTVGERPDN